MRSFRALSQFKLRERLAGIIAKKHGLPLPYANKTLFFLNAKNAIQAYKSFVMMNATEKHRMMFFAVKRKGA